MTDVVNNPPHYKANGIEAIDVIEAFGLGFHLGNVVKYILRAGRKDHLLQDLRKSRWYLDREVMRRETRVAEIGHPEPADFRLCYLATPYSKYKGGNLEAAFEDASQLAALLLAAGVRVYSPIAHTHPLAVYGGLDPLDHSIWLPFDEAMMEAADCLIVAHMDGWDQSYGIAHEVEFFTKRRKLIFDLDPVTLHVTPRNTNPRPAAVDLHSESIREADTPEAAGRGTNDAACRAGDR